MADQPGFAKRRFRRRAGSRRVISMMCGRLIVALSTAATCQTVTAPKEDTTILRERLARMMIPAGRSMPTDAADLNVMLQTGNLAKLTERLRSASTPQQIGLDMNWEQGKIYDGAGFIIAYAYMYDLWRLGSALPGTGGDGLKQSAGMMFLYSFDLITVDGTKCADVSAPSHRRDQLFTQNRPIVEYLRASPRASRMQMGTISLGIETATASVRGNDGVLCSGGLAEMSEALKQPGTKPLPQVSNAPGTFGKTYAVPAAPPGYKPQFVDEAVWRSKQTKAQQDLPASLTHLLSLPTDLQAATPRQ